MDQLREKATRQHTKDHNSRLVLRTIYDAGEISRADLARQTGLTRTTVSEVVGDLILRGLVQEVGHGAVAVGRTPILLSVADDARQALALSVTNDTVQGALVNLRGGLRHTLRRELPSREGDAVLATLLAMAEELAGAAERPLLGIGVNTPGLIDTSSGTVLRTVNFGWEDLPLGEILRERHDLPVYIANDSQSLALAEYLFGSGGAGNLVLIKVGQGIGAGIVLGGQIYAGEGYGAGEIGHIVVVEDGAACKCGNRGCLETVASSAVVLARARELCGAPAMTLADLAAAARAGDEEARQVIAGAGRYLAVAVANIVSVLNVRRILITGRIAPLGELLAQAVRVELRRRALPALVRGTTVEVAAMGEEAPLLGAAAALLTSELGLARLGQAARS